VVGRFCAPPPKIFGDVEKKHAFLGALLNFF